MVLAVVVAGADLGECSSVPGAGSDFAAGLWRHRSGCFSWRRLGAHRRRRYDGAWSRCRGSDRPLATMSGRPLAGPGRWHGLRLLARRVSAGRRRLFRRRDLGRRGDRSWEPSRHRDACSQRRLRSRRWLAARRLAVADCGRVATDLRVCLWTGLLSEFHRRHGTALLRRSRRQQQHFEPRASLLLELE